MTLRPWWAEEKERNACRRLSPAGDVQRVLPSSTPLPLLQLLQLLSAMATFTPAPMLTPGIAVVTGASSGIGRSCAVALSHAGWTVVVSGRRAEELEETARIAKDSALGEIKPVRCVPGDLAKPEDIAALFEVVEKEFGESGCGAALGGKCANTAYCDRTIGPALQRDFAPQPLSHACSSFLAQNAGMNAPKANFEDVQLKDWNAIISINVTAPYLASQHAFRIMRDQLPQGGRSVSLPSSLVFSLTSKQDH